MGVVVIWFLVCVLFCLRLYGVMSVLLGVSSVLG